MNSKDNIVSLTIENILEDFEIYRVFVDKNER